VTIAREEGASPLEIVLDIHRNGGAQAINFGMSEDDVRLIMRHDFVATASDGSAHRPGAGDRPHPRSYGTFPRKIRYSLDDHVIPIEQAIRSCSGLPAEILGLPDRGVLRPGAVADVVVFDPNSFRDASTFDDPTVYAPGIKYLLVGGVALISEGKPTVKPGAKGKLPGRALRRQTDGPAELILIAGRMWTGDAAQPWAEALASRNAVILAVGKKDEVLRFRGPNTRVFDRKDAFAVPGLMDAHGHVESLGASLEEIDLRDVKSLDDVASKVKAQLKVAPSASTLRK